ncbi:hypothetical protein QZH41_018395 [Actinostola sp. cb2023]|nr:hypothetical protein QZH41_018395 [Actinostola sp. cb2023]
MSNSSNTFCTGSRREGLGRLSFPSHHDRRGNKMKASNVTLANCEKDFILQCIRSRKRLDGRETYDYRNIRVSFGVERGHCEVQLGKTRMTEHGVELNRFMERFFGISSCGHGIVVYCSWREGMLLVLFRRPDVSVIGEEVTVIVRCSKIAVVKVTEIIELMKNALAEDEKQRADGKVGVFESAKKITTTSAETTKMDITEAVKIGSGTTSFLPPEGPGTAQIGHGGQNTWEDMKQETNVIQIESDEDMVQKSPANSPPEKQDTRIPSVIAIDDDSEEEEVLVLTPKELSGMKIRPVFTVT